MILSNAILGNYKRSDNNDDDFLLFQVFEDLFTYMKSLDVILNLSPHVIHPGHGPVVTEAVEKVTEYIKHRNMREKQVSSAGTILRVMGIKL